MNELFKQLMDLCDPQDMSKFFYRDFQTLMGTQARVFSYNYASYSDWIKPGALECRGIMFEIDEEGNPVRVMTRPMEKFFNLNENPLSMNLDLSQVVYGMDKADGSLVSTFVDKDILFMKSKTSVSSDQAVAATSMLNDIVNEDLRKRAIELAKSGFTLNFEFVSPTNRIVLPYSEKALILLNVRENDTGEYVSYNDLYKDPVLRKYLVSVTKGNITDKDVQDIREMEGVEGFVFEMADHTKFKLKTDWYVALHRTKDSITKNSALFEAVVQGGSDDLRSMFESDSWALAKIAAFESIYLNYLRESISRLNDTYDSLKGTDRRTFATTAQAKFKDVPYLFSVLMKAYDKGIDQTTLVDRLGEVFIKNYKLFIPKEYALEVETKTE